MGSGRLGLLHRFLLRIHGSWLSLGLGSLGRWLLWLGRLGIRATRHSRGGGSTTSRARSGGRGPSTGVSSPSEAHHLLVDKGGHAAL